MSKLAKKIIPRPDDERMMPEYDGGTLMYAEHITRYQAALDFVKNKVVLDIASGSGYGTNMLAKHASQVYGVDVSEEAIEFSKQNYGAKNIEYKVGDGESIPLDDDSVDVVTTFETIEHIKDYKRFLREVKRVLKPGGVTIVSTPNDLEYPEGNHFHLHEFTYNELLSLLKKQYKYIVPYFQTTYKSVVVGSKDIFDHEHETKIVMQNMSPQTVDHYLYFYFVCSDKKINIDIDPTITLGELYSERKNMEATTKMWEVINSQRDYIHGSTGLLHQLELKTKKVTDMENSLSWRVTKPLRSLNYFVHRVTGRSRS